jgi:four helix bundle protein
MAVGYPGEEMSLMSALTSDRPWRVTAFRRAMHLIDDARNDAEQLSCARLYEPTSRQLFRAVGSIAANISEGYSRSTGLDRARFLEYSLGSVRESLVWYHAGHTVVGSEIVDDRAARLVELRRLLLTSIPTERQRRRVRRVIVPRDDEG